MISKTVCCCLSIQIPNMINIVCTFSEVNLFPFQQSQALANQAEKRQRAFDKSVDEWKRKTADVQTELEHSQHESRGNAAEVYKLRSQLDESHDTIEGLRRDNKNISGKYFWSGQHFE